MRLFSRFQSCGLSLLLAVGAVATGAARARAQDVPGRVIDERGVAVARAEVQVLPSGRPVLTDTAGRFDLGPVQAGVDTVRVRRVGFVPTFVAVRVPLRGKRIEIVLQHSAAVLDTVHTTGIEQQLPRMFDRMQNHLGAALYGPALDSMFARAGSRSLADMMSIDRHFFLQLGHGNDFCVFVDGVSVNGTIEEYISQKEIGAMEAFRSVEFVHEPFPLEHLVMNHWLPCGRTVLIWSKGYQQPHWAGH